MSASPSEIQRLIECSICCDYLNNVRESPCCHNLFCYNCIHNWLEKPTRHCPRCRYDNLIEEHLLINVVIQRFVDNLLFDCPNKVQGCSFKAKRTDLEKHTGTCSYSPNKLEEKQRLKRQERRALLSKCKQGKTEITDNALYDLAKLFLDEREVDSSKECLQMIKDQKKFNTQDVWILQAHGERDIGNFDKALELYEKAYEQAKKPSQRIQLLINIGQMRLKKAQYNQAEQSFSRANELLPIDDRSPNKVEILNALGLIAKKCSDYDRAISMYTQALEKVDPNSQLWSDITSNLADIYRKRGNYEEAKELYFQSLKQAQSLYDENHPSIAEIRNNLALTLKKEGRYDEAMEHLKQALRINKHFFGPQHPSIGIFLTNVGDIYRKQGDFKTAEVTYQEALTCLEQSFGPEHIEVAEVLNSMGLILKKRADYDGAQKLYERAIEIAVKTFGKDQDHYKIGIYYNNLADLDRKRYRFSEALELYRRALNSIEKTFGPEHSEAAEILHNIGLVEYQLGHYKESIDYINNALIIIKKEFSDKHYKYGMFLNSLGLAYAMINDFGMAFVHLNQSLQLLINNLGKNHIEVADVYFNLGDVTMKHVADIEKIKGKHFYDKKIKLEEAKNFYLEAQRIVNSTFGHEHTKALQLASLLFIIHYYESL